MNTTSNRGLKSDPCGTPDVASTKFKSSRLDKNRIERLITITQNCNRPVVFNI